MTDGTAAGTSEVKDLSQYGLLELLRDAIALWPAAASSTSRPATAAGAWISGPATARRPAPPSSRTSPRRRGSRFVSIAHLTAFNGELAFLANDGTDGTQIWVSDGTANGTQMVTDVEHLRPAPSDPTAAGTSLYFFAPDPSTSGEDLWVTNGTAGATSEVASIPSVTPSGQSNAYAATRDGPDGRRVPRLLPRPVRLPASGQGA